MLEFQISTIALTVLNLLILYFILKKLLFGRVNKVLNDRAALIQQTLDSSSDHFCRCTKDRFAIIGPQHKNHQIHRMMCFQ